MAVWLCAIGCVLLVELALFAFSLPVLPPASGSGDGSLFAAPLAATQPASQWLWGLGLLLAGILLGALLERTLKPIRSAYRLLQRHYPDWYQRWPAERRELRLAGLSLSATLLLGVAAAAAGAWHFPFWGALPLSLGLGIGLSIEPLLRYRGLLVEDRPETAPQAALHQILPNYSLNRALFIGQIYLRLLLPAFSLLSMLALPLGLGLISLDALGTLLLLLGLGTGLGWGWRAHGESRLDIEAFRRNFYQLCALSILAAGFLIFGVASGNQVEIVLMSLLSGYLVALY
ncbi:MAG: hypothetical protein ACO1RX_05375 [Candidatus Sericytochromatia bacterium]